MKWSIFKYIFPLCLCFSISIRAQDSLYQEHLNRYRSLWERLIPRHYKLQFAGSMGLLSWGPGWEYGKRHQWETDIFIGFVPKYNSSENKFTFTVKGNYIPWHKKLSDHFDIDPLTVSLYTNSILSDKYWKKEPNKYPKGYYGFSTRVRINIALGQRFVYHIPSERIKYNKSITFFYELSTNELYVVSAFTNKYLKLSDIVHLSFGLKMQVF